MDSRINISISIVIFSILIGIHGMVQPFVKKYKNNYYQELVYYSLIYKDCMSFHCIVKVLAIQLLLT